MKRTLNNIKSNVTFIWIAMCLSILICCNSKKDDYRLIITMGLDRESKNLPIDISEGLSFEKLKVDGDYIYVEYSIAEANIKDYLNLNDSTLTSDKNIARILDKFDNEVKNSIVDAELGFIFVYKIKESKRIASKVEVTPDKLKNILEKMSRGELKAYSILDMFEDEIKAIKFPKRVDKYTIMKNAEIKDNNMHYLMEIEIGNLKFTDEMISLMKKEMINDLNHSPIVAHKEALLKEGTHIIYDFVDTGGSKLFTIDISPIDLRNPKITPSSLYTNY